MLKLRIMIAAVSGLTVAAVANGAQGDPALDDSALLSELKSEFKLPAWDFGTDFALGAGYRENVLLAAFAPDSSAFLRASVDVLAWRYPTENGVEWVNFLDATSTHYFSAATDDALLIIARSERRWRQDDRWRFAVAGQFVHQDEVIDISTLDFGLASEDAQLNSFEIKPTVEWAFADDWSWIAEVGAKFDDFRPPLDDFGESTAESGLRRNLGRWGDIRFTYGYLWRDYLDRPQSAVGGRPLDGTKLRVGQQKLETRYEIQGGEAWKWDVDLWASYMANEDNGSGWYDYDRRVIGSSWSTRNDVWSIEADAGWRRYDYRVQTVGFGDPPKRERTEWTAYVRVERSVSESLALFSEFEWEHSVSNDVFLDYDDRTVVLGVNWSWSP